VEIHGAKTARRGGKLGNPSGRIKENEGRIGGIGTVFMVRKKIKDTRGGSSSPKSRYVRAPLEKKQGERKIYVLPSIAAVAITRKVRINSISGIKGKKSARGEEREKGGGNL